MSSWYFYTGAISFAGGVLLSSFFPLSSWVAAWLCALAFTLIMYWRKQFYTNTTPFILVLAIIFLGGAIGVARFEYSATKYQSVALSSLVGQSKVLNVLVVREPDIRETTKHLVLKIDDSLVLLIVDRYTEGNYGDRLHVSGELQVPRSFTSDLGRTFNYPGYLRAQGIAYVMMFPDIVVLESGQGNVLLSGLYDIKQTFSKNLTAFVPEPAAGLGLGILLGIKQALGENLEVIFRQTGIIHIVVLSGYNIMLVVAAVMYVLAAVLPIRTRAVVGIVAIILFALLVGLSATVIRASVMAGLVLAAQIFGRRYDVMRALVVAGVGMVLYQPYILAFDIGFQLSFMATLGLVLVAPYFETLLVRAPSKLGMKEFLVATIATQVAVAPLLLFHIGEISLVAVVANVLVLPLVPFAMLATAITGLFATLLPILAPLPALLAYGILTTIITVATWCALIPFASVTVPVFPWYGVPIAYGFVGFVFYMWKKRQLKALVIPVPPSFANSINVDTWTIVNERENTLLSIVEEKNVNINGREHRSRPSDDTPIFFR